MPFVVIESNNVEDFERKINKFEESIEFTHTIKDIKFTTEDCGNFYCVLIRYKES